MNSHVIQANAAAATQDFLLRRAVRCDSPELVKFWCARARYYENFALRSQPENFLGFATGEAPPPNLETIQQAEQDIFRDLPAISLGRSNSTWRIKICGEIFFSSRPADIIGKIPADAREVELRLDCVGGSMAWADEFSARLVALKKPITAIVKRAFSAAVTISQVAHRRLIERDGQMMIHAGHTAVVGTASQLEEAAARLRSLEQSDAELLRLRTRQPAEVVASWMSGGDRYFDAEEALSVGLVDEVLSE